MRDYKLGLMEGGLMEDPGWHIENIKTVSAETLIEAKQKWAEQTNHVDQYWNEKQKTYWGWSVVEIK